VDADAELDTLFWRQASIALDHRPLDFNRAVDRVDDASEFDNASVAGTLHNLAVMHGDSQVDQVAPKGANSSENSIRVRSRKSGVGDDIGH
jgi:hypothetical protein